MEAGVQVINPPGTPPFTEGGTTLEVSRPYLDHFIDHVPILSYTWPDVLNIHHGF